MLESNTYVLFIACVVSYDMNVFQFVWYDTKNIICSNNNRIIIINMLHEFVKIGLYKISKFVIKIVGDRMKNVFFSLYIIYFIHLLYYYY